MAERTTEISLKDVAAIVGGMESTKNLLRTVNVEDQGYYTGEAHGDLLRVDVVVCALAKNILQEAFADASFGEQIQKMLEQGVSDQYVINFCEMLLGIMRESKIFGGTAMISDREIMNLLRMYDYVQPFLSAKGLLI